VCVFNVTEMIYSWASVEGLWSVRMGTCAVCPPLRGGWSTQHDCALMSRTGHLWTALTFHTSPLTYDNSGMFFRARFNDSYQESKFCMDQRAERAVITVTAIQYWIVKILTADGIPVALLDIQFRIFCRTASSGMLRRVALVRTDVSEELSASIIEVTRIGELGITLTVTSNRRTLRFLLPWWWRR
jgi:hypothetical protein